ncbi:MAG: FAD-binding protein [Chloroflexi bacterium]|nr:FAD-binding protein [Chloroflexota bacterium]
MTKLELNKLAPHVTETDVLILGAGAAGCLAAIGAREQGAEVTIVEKGQIDSSGCCGGGQDHFAAHLNTGPDWDSDEAATNFYAGPGWGAGRRLVEKAFTTVVGPMVKRMEDMGIDFYKTEDGQYWRTQALGTPGPWHMMMKDGVHVKRKMAEKVRQAGANVIEHVMVTRLLINNGRVAGAVGFNIKNGELYIFRGKIVVLAMGAHQSRWSTNSTDNPFNIWQSPYNTGTQLVVAYEAGAKVVNLEKCVATTMPKGFGAPAMNAFAGMGGFMVNVLGEKFMEKYHALGEKAPRGYHISGQRQEEAEGRVPFYVDVRHISESDLKHLEKNLLTVDKNTFSDYLKQRGIDLSKDLLEVELGEYSGGGNIWVDENLESNLKGLFALPFSGMLSTAMCGGLVAGSEAAKAALRVKKLPEVRVGDVVKEKARIFQPLKRDTGYTPKEFEDLIRQVMKSYMGYNRSVKGLETALERLTQLEDLASEIRADNLHEVLRANEAVHLLKYCQLMVKAVMERKGARGFYRITDYARTDIELRAKHIALFQENGKQKVSYEPLD